MCVGWRWWSPPRDGHKIVAVRTVVVVRENRPGTIKKTQLQQIENEWISNQIKTKQNNSFFIKLFSSKERRLAASHTHKSSIIMTPFAAKSISLIDWIIVMRYFYIKSAISANLNYNNKIKCKIVCGHVTMVVSKWDSDVKVCSGANADLFLSVYKNVKDMICVCALTAIKREREREIVFSGVCGCYLHGCFWDPLVEPCWRLPTANVELMLKHLSDVSVFAFRLLFSRNFPVLLDVVFRFQIFATWWEKTRFISSCFS